MAGLQNSRKGLDGKKGTPASEQNLDNTYVEGNKPEDLTTQIANVEADTQVLLSELALYNNGLVDPLKASDPTKNSVEKLLNLKANQGLISSALTLINRPAESAQGALVAAMNPTTGESMVKNALDGLAGNKEFGFNDLGIDLGGNQFVNATAGLMFEVLVDPLNFVNQPFKLAYTKGKDIFKGVKTKAELFFSKTESGSAAYQDFTEVMNKAGTLVKKSFNLWKDEGMKVVSNELSNMKSAIDRGKSQAALLTKSLLDQSVVIPQEVVRDWSKYSFEHQKEIKEALELTDNWTPPEELTKLMQSSNGDNELFKKGFAEVSQESREAFINLNNRVGSYLGQFGEFPFHHGGNFSDELSKLADSKYTSISTKDFSGTEKLIRSDAYTDVNVKTMGEFTNSETYRVIIDTLEKATGKKLVSGTPKSLGEVNVNDYIKTQEGVGRLQIDNINQGIDSPSGGTMTTFSEQGAQAYLTDLGKTQMRGYLKRLNNTKMAQTITNNFVGDEAKWLIDLVNFGVIKFNPNKIDAVQQFIKPLQETYKVATGTELKFVTTQMDGALMMKIVPDSKYGMNFIPEFVNEQALNRATELIDKALNPQIEKARELMRVTESLNDNITKFKEMEQSVDMHFQDATVMGMIIEDLQKTAGKKEFVTLQEDASFLKFVRNAEEGAGVNAPFAPSDSSVKFVNTELSKHKGKFEAVETNGMTFHWDRLETGVSSSSFPMQVDFTKLSGKQKMNYATYLRDRGIISDETLQVAGITKWSDFNNTSKLDEAFKAGYFPQTLNVKVAGLTSKSDVSNSYINLAQWNKLGETPFKTISPAMFTKQVSRVNKEILDGKWVSEENIKGMFDYFSISETKETLTSSLFKIGAPETKELITQMRQEKYNISILKRQQTKLQNETALVDIETKIHGIVDGNALTKTSLNQGTTLINEVAVNINKVGKDVYVNNKMEEIKSYEMRIEEISEEILPTAAATLQKAASRSLANFNNIRANSVLFDFMQNQGFKDSGRYTSTNIIDILDMGADNYVGIIRLPNNSWEFATADRMEAMKKVMTPKGIAKKVITFSSQSQKTAFIESTLRGLRKSNNTRKINELNNLMFDANSELIFALNMGDMNKAYKALDYKQIEYLKNQNYAKAANAMTNEISIADIQYAIRKETKLSREAQTKLDELVKRSKVQVDEAGFKKTKETTQKTRDEITQTKQDITTSRQKITEYSKEEYKITKRSKEEQEIQYNKANDQEVNGTLDQIADGLNSPIKAFYNPLSNASPQFVMDQYLAGQRSDLLFVAELLTKRKNIRPTESTFKRLPDIFEAQVNKFVNIQQASNAFLVRFVKEATGIDIGAWEVAGYLRHILSTDAAVIKIMQNIPEGMASSIGGQMFGNNAAKIYLARKYQGSVNDINAALGTEIFNSNPIQAMAMALSITPQSFKRAATIKSLVNNRLITGVSLKDYAGFNPARTETDIVTRIGNLEKRIKKINDKGKRNNKLEDELSKYKQDLANVQEYRKAESQIVELKEKAFNLKEQEEFNQIKIAKEAEIKELITSKNLVRGDIKKTKLIDDQIDAIKNELKLAEESVKAGKLTGAEREVALTKLTNLEDTMRKLAPKLQAADTRDFVDAQKWLDNNPQFSGQAGEWAIMDAGMVKQVEDAVNLLYKVDPHTLDNSDWGSAIKNLVKDLKSGETQNVIHKGALEIIKTLGTRSSNAEANALLRSFKKLVVDPWKAIGISTLGFHARNFLTNIINAFLFGLDITKVFSGAARHNSNLKGFHKHLGSLEAATATGKWRTSDEQGDMIWNLISETDSVARDAFFKSYDAMDIAKMYTVTPESALIFEEMMDLTAKGIVGNNQLNNDIFEEALGVINDAKGKKQKFKMQLQGSAGKGVDSLKKFMQMSINFSKQIDDSFKIGVYNYIKNLNVSDAKDLGVLRKMAEMGFTKKVQNADGAWKIVYRKDIPDLAEIDVEAAAKFVGFDYNNLSNTENTVMKTIFPFFTWARKNLEFQMKNVLYNDKKYRTLNKALLGWRRAFVSEDEEYEYQENYIPIWTSNGEVQYLKFSIPFFEADEIISGGGIVNALSPVFKAPLEMITGFDFFTQREIESNQNPGFGLGLNNIFRTGEIITDMVFQDYAPSYEDKKLAGMLGKKLIDVTQVVKNVFSFSEQMQNDNMVNGIAAMFPSIFSAQTIANVKYQNALIKRKRAQEALNYLKNNNR